MKQESQTNKHGALMYVLVAVVLISHFFINRRIQIINLSNIIWYYEVTRNWTEIAHSVLWVILDCIVSIIASKLIHDTKLLMVSQLADLFLSALMSLLLLFVIIKDTLLALCFDMYSLQSLTMLFIEGLFLILRFVIPGIPIHSTILSFVNRAKKFLS